SLPLQPSPPLASLRAPQCQKAPTRINVRLDRSSRKVRRDLDFSLDEFGEHSWRTALFLYRAPPESALHLRRGENYELRAVPSTTLAIRRRFAIHPGGCPVRGRIPPSIPKTVQ